jgi:hypothetical protein
MQDRKKYKCLSYEETIQMIEEVKGNIEKHNSGRLDLPEGFSYRDAIITLGYLRNRARSLKMKL